MQDLIGRASWDDALVRADVRDFACSHRMPTGLGVQRAGQIAAGLPKQAWQRVSAGAGAKGYRYCDWAFLTLPRAIDEHQGHHRLLIRRNRATGELAFYPLLVRGTGATAPPGRRRGLPVAYRGVVPSCHDRARSGPAPAPPLESVARWTALVIAAYALLAAATTVSTTSPNGLIDITVNELNYTGCFTPWSSNPSDASPTSSPGQSSGAGIKP